jgi:hypothetical protein
MLSSKMEDKMPAARTPRSKLSSTVARENYAFLQRMVASGAAANLAQALDMAIEGLRFLENRKRLAQATARYYGGLSPEALSEENELAHDMSALGNGVDFDQEL